jgi:DNA polymerase-1
VYAVHNAWLPTVLRIRDTIAGERITFHYVQSQADIQEFKRFVLSKRWLAIDTESTGINCYRPDWQLRTVQVGDARRCYVVPARYKQLIKWLMHVPLVKWIGHNGPHDIRSIDIHLGYETGVVCAGETYIPSHHLDSRNQQEGGVGHALKELACAMVDREADKWERALKAVFKTITIPVPGEVYKSGPRKGQPKVRKAKLSEGWSLIDPEHPAYLAYAASDPILTYRVWQKLYTVYKQFRRLYLFDSRVQRACDRLQRRGIRLDTRYTSRLSEAFSRAEWDAVNVGWELGCSNVQSGQQIAAALIGYGVKLTERTPKGQYKMDGRIMREIMAARSTVPAAQGLLRAVLRAKQVSKRRESYTNQMLSEMDSAGRVHPSINTLGARTARMSVSNPPLQQLPTKDSEESEDG